MENLEATEPENFIDNDKANVERLNHAYKETVTDLSEWVEQQRTNYNVRHCLWANQSEDGKKHGDPDNPAFPWDGASDLRTFVVDQMITSDVAMLCTSLQRANLAAVPVEFSDTKRSKLVTSFMRWLIYSQMDELQDECELLANYYLEKGIGALGVFWETKVSTKLQTVTVEQMAEVAPELAGYIQDKSYAKDITDLMQSYFPNLSRRKARKMVTELRNTGSTEFGTPEVVYQRPKICAYSLDRDLFVPSGTTHIQNAPYIFMENWYTPDMLRAKVTTDGWDKDFVEYVIDTQQNETTQRELYAGSEWETRYGIEANYKTENIKLVCAYYRTSDEDGIPEINYTVFHPDVTHIDGVQAYAIHAKLDYSPARYPFVVFQRERLSRRLLETRGYPEIAKGWQDQIKIERDTRIDRASLSTNPPFLYRNGKQPAAWGPGAKIPFQRREDYGWAEIPPFDQGSIEVEQKIEDSMRRYFGRSTSEEDQGETRAVQQALVQKWLNSWKEVFRQIWSLYKQYGPEEQFFRVVGSEKAEDRMVKGDDNEKYDFYLSFDVPGTDPEYQLKKMESMAKMAMQFDRTGRVDWSKVIGEVLAAHDPIIADKILIPQEEATEKEMNEEKDLITRMWSGMDVDLQMPFNPQLRMQVFQDWLSGSETIPASDVQQRLQSDPAFKARVEKHQKQIQQQIAQQQNAQIGQLGTAPGNM